MAFCDDRYIAGNTQVVAAFFKETRAALAKVGAEYRRIMPYISSPSNEITLDRFDVRLNLHQNYNIEKEGSHIGKDNCKIKRNRRSVTK